MPVHQGLWRILRALFRITRARQYRYKRLVEIRISRESLLHNYRVFQEEYPNVGIAPVLKSNAYGHGLVAVARILEKVRPPFLVVEGYYEALILRNEGIHTPILVMGYTATENILKSRLKDVAYALVDLSQILEIPAKLRRPQQFHLKLDTGMRRYGIVPDDLERILKLLKASEHVQLVGACSHLAVAMSMDDRVAKEQIRIWNNAAGTIKQHFPEIRSLHLASTAGSYWSNEIDANVIRLGLGAYGFDTSPRRALPLRPVLSMTSTIGAVRQIAPGDSIGYGHIFTAERAMTVATVASGYYAGVLMSLSNRGAFMVREKVCPIVGRVCMNGTMIDVSAVAEVQVGEKVTLISASPEEANSIDSIAHMTRTSRHVLLTGIPSRIRRIVV